MRVAMLALVTAVVVGVSPAQAGGGVKGDWELGIYGGYGFLDDYGGFNPENGPLYGGRFGHFFSNHWSAEFSAQRMSTERDTTGQPEIKLGLNSYRGNLLYNFAPGASVRPFLTAGLGGETVDIEDVGDNESTTEMGWNVGGGLRFMMGERWCLRADGRYVSVHLDKLDETEANMEATLGLSLLFGGSGGHDVADAPPPAAAPVNHVPSVTCAPDRAEILPGETVRVVATAADADGDPLTYAWTSSAGVVSGTGPAATLDFSGVTGPSTATVSVRVSDGRGGIVTCETSVNRMEAVKAAESASCLAGGFPRNAARLTNVDKACLDDYVQRLQADPRAKVVVIGHADTRESSSQRVGQQRADAVKAYLVQAGVESSRVTTRSVGSTRLLDSSDATRNRRVEVWFVPEGAKDPD